MAVIKLDIDKETLRRLSENAVAERRPLPLQAEVELRRGLGLPFPVRPTRDGEESTR